MTTAEYDKILFTLRAASEVIAAHRAELSATDIRIRSLLEITRKESNRGRLEAEHRAKLATDAGLPALNVVLAPPPRSLPIKLPANVTLV